MRYYILDDSISVVKILNKIVEEHDLGEVIGVNTNPEAAVKEIIASEPEVVLIDYLMPKEDGISVVRKIREIKPRVRFVMISQVSDKEMVAEAYKEGIQFFINKPINLVEVTSVLNNVNEKVDLEQTLGGIKKMLHSKGEMRKNDEAEKPTDKKQNLKEIKYLLNVLGMLGEGGSGDIIKICEERLNHTEETVKGTIEKYCVSSSEELKPVRQRMRRAVKRGLTNLAAMGVEDFYNETFQAYHTVFDFESVRTEMDYIRGKRKDGGRVNVEKFIEGLIVCSEIK